MTMQCKLIPRKKRSNPSPSSEGLTTNMKKIRRADDCTMAVYNLPPNAFYEFQGFLTSKISEMHNGECVEIVSCNEWHSDKKFLSLLVEFPDTRQRNLALSINGVLYFDRKLRAERYDASRQAGKGYVKKKHYLCSFFAAGRCHYDADFCRYAHGVLDLKLYPDTQLQKERCVFIQQIDLKSSSSDLLNLIKGEFKQHEDSELIITAVHHRQQMGDAVVEFGNPVLAQKAHELLNGLRSGPHDLTTHPWESKYHGIFMNYFDNNIQTPIEVDGEALSAADIARQMSQHIRSHRPSQVESRRREAPLPSVGVHPRRVSLELPRASDIARKQVEKEPRKTAPAISALPRSILAESSANVSEAVDPPQVPNRQVEAVPPTEASVLPAATARPRRVSLDRPSQASNLTRPQVEATRKETPPAAAALPRRISVGPPKIAILKRRQIETEQEETRKEDEATPEQAPTPTDLPSRNALDHSPPRTPPKLRIRIKRPRRISLEPMQASNPVNDSGVAQCHSMVASSTVSSTKDSPNKNGQGIESLLDACQFAARNHTLENARNENSQNSSSSDEESLGSDDDSDDSFEETPPRSKSLPQEDEDSEETVQEPPSEQEPTGTRQGLANANALEAPSDMMQDSEPSRAQCDLEMDRMRREIAKLKSEQAQKDQLIQDLKKKNAETETQLDASRKDARCHLEKLVHQQRQTAKVEKEVERLRQENENLLPQLRIKEEETKHLKVEVYDLLKDRCDVIADIKKLCGQISHGQTGKIKSDQDGPADAVDQITRGHETGDGIGSSLDNILELKKHLQEVSSYVMQTEAENEKLRDENEVLEGELEQMRMCQGMDEGFAGE